MESVPVLPVHKANNETKYHEIAKYFTSCFGSSPQFFARVPGRVNLIGEHIDYCGFSVLPMAIDQDIVLAVGINYDDVLNLINFHGDKYEKFSSSVKDLNINTSSPRWYHYFICGFKGIAEKYDISFKGLDIAVKGIIPPSSGLSSSSALVCASALAASFVNRIFPSKMEIASICAEAERYIGTQGGGMDQAIAFLAEPGTAKLIEFNPLRATSVTLPKGVAFVVSNSCVAMNKAATSQYNMRVMECKLAAKVLAKRFGFNWRYVEKLAEIPVLLGKDVSEMTVVIKDVLESKCYSKPELCSILEISDFEFTSLLTKNTLHMEEFQLAQRAEHVFQEATRVMNFKSVCENSSGDKIHELGRLMNESHESCRDLYDCSHPDLDELVRISLEAGAKGSRLTGAGWGGCCVSLVMENQVDEFLNAVKRNFYGKKALSQTIDVETVMFLSKPSGGAVIYIVDNYAV